MCSPPPSATGLASPGPTKPAPPGSLAMPPGSPLSGILCCCVCPCGHAASRDQKLLSAWAGTPAARDGVDNVYRQTTYQHIDAGAQAYAVWVHTGRKALGARASAAHLDSQIWHSKTTACRGSLWRAQKSGRCAAVNASVRNAAWRCKDTYIRSRHFAQTVQLPGGAQKARAVSSHL